MSDGALLAAVKNDILRRWKLYDSNNKKDDDHFKPHMALLMKHMEGKEAFTDEQGLAGTVTRTIMNKYDALTWARFIQVLYLAYIEYADFTFVFYPKTGKPHVHQFTMQLHRGNYDKTPNKDKMPFEDQEGKRVYHASIDKRKQDNSIIAYMVKKLFYSLGIYNPTNPDSPIKTSYYSKLLHEYQANYTDFNKNKKARRAELQNFSSELTKDHITWKNVIRALRVAQVTAFDLKIDMRRYDGEEHKIEYTVTV